MNINKMSKDELIEKLNRIKSIVVECNRTIIALNILLHEKQTAINKKIKRKNEYEKIIKELKEEIKTYE